MKMKDLLDNDNKIEMYYIEKLELYKLKYDDVLLWMCVSVFNCRYGHRLRYHCLARRSICVEGRGARTRWL